MPGDIDRADLLEPEVPLGVRVEEGPDEPPAGPVTCSGTSRARSRLIRSSRSLMPTMSSLCPVNVVPSTTATPMVFSSTWVCTSSGRSCTYRAAAARSALDVEVAAELSHTTCTSPPNTRFGLDVDAPAASRRFRQFHFRDNPPSLIASDDPWVRLPSSRRRVEEVGDHPNAPLLNLGRTGIFGVVDEIAVQVSRR